MQMRQLPWLPFFVAMTTVITSKITFDKVEILFSARILGFSRNEQIFFKFWHYFEKIEPNRLPLSNGCYENKKK